MIPAIRPPATAFILRTQHPVMMGICAMVMKCAPTGHARLEFLWIAMITIAARSTCVFRPKDAIIPTSLYARPVSHLVMPATVGGHAEAGRILSHTSAIESLLSTISLTRCLVIRSNVALVEESSG